MILTNSKSKLLKKTELFYPLYVHWIPTHQNLSIRSIDIIKDYLNEKYSAKTGISSEFKDVVEKEYLHSFLSYKDQDLNVIVFRSGLFVVKGIQKDIQKQIRQNILPFVERADNLYVEVRDLIHKHIFNHKLTKHFPVAWIFPNNLEWKTLRPHILELLKENYLNDFVEEQNLTSQKKELALKDIIVATLHFQGLSGFLKLYWRINDLIEFRLKTASIYERIAHCRGIQSFISSFIGLTQMSDESKENRIRKECVASFNEGYCAAENISREFSEVMSSYTLQGLFLVITAALIFVPFVIVILEQAIHYAGNLWWSTLLLIFGFLGFAYTSVYIASLRIARRTGKFTIRYFDIN